MALISSPAAAQTNGNPTAAVAPADGPDIVVVKVFENTNFLIIDIARAKGKREQRSFKPSDLREKGPGAAELTRQLLAQLYQEGYALTSTYGGGDHFSNLNTLVFTRRP